MLAGRQPRPDNHPLSSRVRPTLEAIAHGVTVSTPPDVAVTSAKRVVGGLGVIAVIGPPDAVALLLNTTCQRAALLEHLAGGRAWDGCNSCPR